MEINQSQPTDVTPQWTRWRKPMFPDRSVRVSDGGKKVNVGYIFDLRSLVLAKHSNGSEGILVNDNITACIKQLCLLYVKFRIEKPCQVKHFEFFNSLSHQFFNFVLWVSCFLSLRAANWPSTNFFGMYCCPPALSSVYGRENDIISISI